MLACAQIFSNESINTKWKWILWMVLYRLIVWKMHAYIIAARIEIKCLLPVSGLIVIGGRRHSYCRFKHETHLLATRARHNTCFWSKCIWLCITLLLTLTWNLFTLLIKGKYEIYTHFTHAHTHTHTCLAHTNIALSFSVLPPQPLHFELEMKKHKMNYKTNNSRNKRTGKDQNRWRARSKL